MSANRTAPQRAQEAPLLMVRERLRIFKIVLHIQFEMNDCHSELTSLTLGGPPGSEWSDSRAGWNQVKYIQRRRPKKLVFGREGTLSTGAKDGLNLSRLTILSENDAQAEFI